MNPLVRCQLQSRLLPISIARCIAGASSSSSPKPGMDPSLEESLKKRNRSLEPQLTKGELWSRANVAPQMYETSMEDNFQRTTVNPVTKEMAESKRNCILTCSEVGFKLSDETVLLGPIALFPKTMLSWRVLNPDEITPESMVLFTVLEPKLDIVVVGVGDKKYIRPVRERLQPLFRKHQIMLEVLDTPDACATFNFLNNEGRYVAAALFPPLELPHQPHDQRHVSSADWDKVRHGWFGASHIESANVLEDFKKRIEISVKKIQERHVALRPKEHKEDTDDKDKKE